MMNNNNLIMNSDLPKPLCPKCKGSKWYPISKLLEDGQVVLEVVCEVCCQHDKGFTKLIGTGFGDLEGKYTCVAGCGFVIDKLAQS